MFWELRSEQGRRPLEVQGTTWRREPTWPWETLLDGLRQGVQFLGSYPGGHFTVDAVLVLVALATGVWVAVRVRPTYAVWLWASLLLPLVLPFDGRALLSVPRFLVVLFPVVWALARLAERWRAHDAVVAASAAGLGLLSLLFVNWYFIF